MAPLSLENRTGPLWRAFSDTERLEWLIDNCDMPGVSREAIDDAIAREKFFKEKARG